MKNNKLPNINKRDIDIKLKSARISHYNREDNKMNSRFLGQKKKRSILRKIIKFFAVIFVAILLFFVGAAISFLISFKGLWDFLPHIPELVGFSSGERTYLIVFQNNNELRPTGGFISSYGILKFNKGAYQGLEVKDVYSDTEQENQIDPPYPLKELMGTKDMPFNYSFRDGNFYPQFPLTARNLEKMFKMTHPDININGVIAINFNVLEDLLGVTGELEVDEMIIDNNNVFEKIEKEVNNIDRHNLDDLAGRKNILNLIAEELEKEVFSKPEIWPEIGKMILENLNQKSIQCYFKDYDLQKLVVEKEWAGAWKSTTGDYFAVNEANYGGLKSNRYMKKDITYEVSISPNPKGGNYSIESYLKVKIYHYGIENIPISGKYSGYFRIYVPQGAKLVKTSGGKNPTKNIEKFYYFFSNLVYINPGEEETLTYQYKLPSGIIKDNNYSLYIPKQSGADEDIYNIIIKLPQGYSMESDTLKVKENIGFYTGKIIKDLNFDLEITSDTNSPYVIYQRIENLNTAVIWFNEEINEESAQKISNYNFTDTNQINTKESNELKIENVKAEGKKITITYEGMTFQPEERFILEFKGLKDLNGNFTDPDTKSITMVQRIDKPVQTQSLYGDEDPAAEY